MSTKTIRKRIAVAATSALLAGVFSAISAPTSIAHNVAGAANTLTSVGQVAGTNTTTPGTIVGSLFVATAANTGVNAQQPHAGSTNAGVAYQSGVCAAANATAISHNALSKGLLAKDTSSGVAQTATALPGAVLALYGCTATAVAFFASAGSINPSNSTAVSSGWSYNSSNTKVWSPDVATAVVGGAGTGVGALWTLPSTPGVYTISYYTGFYTPANGTPVIATATNGGTPATLSGAITVTVVATSAGGSPDSSNSVCQAVQGSTTGPTSSVDSPVTTLANGSAWSIDFALRDAYNVALASTGNLVATATNGALLAIGTAGATPVAGTTSTTTATGSGSNNTVRVDQGTAGKQMTTTVTITWNGTVVCTKTVSISGTVAALTVANIAVQDLGASAGNAAWFTGETRAGTFYVIATDTSGGRIATSSSVGTYGVDDATLGTTVNAVIFDAGSLATGTSSTSVTSATVGRHACTANAAGTQKGVVIKFTLANGTVIKSAPFDLSCGDDPASYTASLDKAKYVSGEVAKLTVTWKDSKGNIPNNVVATAGSTIVMPGMTLVSTTGVATAVVKTGGKIEYTYTVGQTAGKYAGVVDFTSSAAGAQFATVQNPSYEITSGGDTTTNADVLKSIVALIASINKQIQALQKLILARR